ncbi:MAG: DUF2892 domain-containing protein [Candidatus Poseidoniales archaeon]|nr:MAG: DUF2892 domain-containing protein [Candidatus Poseidoniales archaeon]
MIEMTGEGFKLIITNQSNKDRIIRLSIALALIGIYFLSPSEINNSLITIGLGIAGVLIFNVISGNCYIYRALGINTCPVDLENH